MWGAHLARANIDAHEAGDNEHIKVDIKWNVQNEHGQGVALKVVHIRNLEANVELLRIPSEIVKC